MNNEREPRCYRIIRYFSPGADAAHRTKRVVRNNVTLTEAQAHCGRKDTRVAGRWFDGYDWMPGCEPAEEGK